MPTPTSRDGTTIAYDVVGDGPAVILVDGALGCRAFGGSPQLAASSHMDAGRTPTTVAAAETAVSRGQHHC
jgi:hypothetical protein